MSCIFDSVYSFSDRENIIGYDKFGNNICWYCHEESDDSKLFKVVFYEIPSKTEYLPRRKF